MRMPMSLDQCKTWLVYVLSVLMGVHPFQVGADDFLGAAQQGAQFSENSSIDVLPNVSNGEISFGDNDRLSVSELFPDTTSANSYPYAPSQNDLETESSSGSGMAQLGSGALSGMKNEVSQEGGPTSIQGMAFEVVNEAGDLARPDFKNDPMLNQSRNVFEGMDTFEQEFADCSASDSFVASSFSTHLPDYQRCTVVEDRSQTCQIRHDYEARVVSPHGDLLNVSSCGEGCMNTWIGKVGDNYWSGNCKIYTQATEMVVDAPEAITSAVLNRAKWDDYMQVYLGEAENEALIWESYPGTFPPETSGRCELDTSWDRNPNVDLTDIFQNAAPGEVLRFKIRVSVTGNGEGYGRINIRYDPSKAIKNDTWSTASCIDSAKAIADGYAEGDLVCANNPADANGCMVSNGVTICSDMLAPSPLPGISNMCQSLDIEASYDFYKGDMQCWNDPSGDEVCVTNEGGNLNSCDTFESNPECGFISSTCVEGAEGDSGRCYVREDTYDCGSAQTVPTLERDSSYECAGPIRCMGSECVDQTAEKSPDFARATAALNAAQFMTQDLSCTGVDGTGGIVGDENVSCSVFQGTAGECKKAVGGIVDCCEAPAGINLGDYLTMIMTVPKIDSGIMGLKGTAADAVYGAYNTLREPAMSSWSSITKPFTSRIESISGTWDTMQGAVQDKVLEFTGPLREKVAEMTGDVIFGAAEGAGVQAGVDGASSGVTQSFSEQLLGQGGSAFLSTAMTAYQIYVVTMLAIQLIWECEAEEFEMNAQRELKSCHYVGSYCKTKILGKCIEKREAHCCFTSPLSRIIQEQVRLQTGQGWGTAKSPQCGGLPVDQLASVDWSAINLDEWLAILSSQGLFAGDGAFDLSSLTGTDTALDVGERVDATERTLNRFEGTDIDTSRRDVQEQLRGAQ